MTTYDWITGEDTLGLNQKLTGRYGQYGDWQCPCGQGGYYGMCGGSEAKHAHAHLNWATGIRLNERQDVLFVCRNDRSNTMLVVDSGSDQPLRKLAYDVARLFQREQGYDFPMVPHPSSFWTEDNGTAYLAIFRRRAIALLVVQSVPRWGYYDNVNENGRIPFDQIHPARSIAGIFTCGNYRRRGVAAALIRRATEREAVPLEQVPWCTPLSDAGAALATHLVPSGLRVC